MKIGYARVSTHDQNLALQIQALKQEGCEKIFYEKISSGAKRPELEKLLSSLKEGDTIVVWKLDRIGRSVIELITIIVKLNEKGVKFKSIQETFDTNTSIGLVIYNFLAFVAEMERNNIRERTRAGLEVAKKEGRVGGRPRGVSNKNREIAKRVKEMFDHGKSVSSIARELEINRGTVYRYLSWQEDSKKE